MFSEYSVLPAPVLASLLIEFTTAIIRIDKLFTLRHTLLQCHSFNSVITIRFTYIYRAIIEYTRVISTLYSPYQIQYNKK